MAAAAGLGYAAGVTPADAHPTIARAAAAPSVRYATPATWADAQRPHLDTLLVEQAHLEKKAAACAVQFLFRVPPAAHGHKALSALAREELVHFERTLRLLQQRGLALAPLPPCDYAGRLKAGCSSKMPERLVDELLVAGIIEARSHERLLLLAAALPGHDDELAAFYADLGAAEERHEGIYVELAGEVMPPDVVAVRHDAMLAHEARVLTALPFGPRLHSGVVGLDGGIVGLDGAMPIAAHAR